MEGFEGVAVDVNGVDGAEVGGDGVRDLVEVRPLHGEAAHVAVGVDEARGGGEARGVQDLSPLRGEVPAGSADFPAVHEDVPLLGDRAVLHGVEHSVSDEEHISPPPF